MRQAIDDALKSRWIELEPVSAPWPCDMAGAAAIALKEPARVAEPKSPMYEPKGIYSSMAVVDPPALQDLVEALPDVIKATAGLPLQFQLHISLGDGTEYDPSIVQAINVLLTTVNPDLCLKR